MSMVKVGVLYNAGEAMRDDLRELENDVRKMKRRIQRHDEKMVTELVQSGMQHLVKVDQSKLRREMEHAGTVAPVAAADDGNLKA